MKLRSTVFFLSGLLTACAINEADVNSWKSTTKGPQKLVGVVRADKYNMQLRSLAAVALLDMDRTDVDGPAELNNALAKLNPSTKEHIMKAVIPRLINILDHGEVKAGEEPEARQVRAKDAAFMFLDDAPPELKPDLIRALVAWYAKDFNGRNLSGTATADQVVRGIGAPAAHHLVGALDAKMPPAVLVKISELIGQTGDTQTKRRAGERLIAIYKEMQGPEFLAWLKTRIEDQLRQQAPHEKIDPVRVAKAAEINRVNFIIDGALSAMKFLAAEDRVADLLLDVATKHGIGEEDIQRRIAAFRGLEGHVRRKHLPQIAAIALDASMPSALRDEAFDRLGDIGSEEILYRMWSLLGNTKDDKLRWRAGELILSSGGQAVLERFFSSLPKPGAANYSPAELEGYAARIGQMNPPPSQSMKGYLHGPNWAVQVIALRYFERVADKEYLPWVKELQQSTTPLTGKGWQKNQTLGLLATEVSKSLSAAPEPSSG